MTSAAAYLKYVVPTCEVTLTVSMPAGRSVVQIRAGLEAVSVASAKSAMDFVSALGYIRMQYEYLRYFSYARR